MKNIDDICYDLDSLTQLTRIIAMSESSGMNYSHEEISAAFRTIWKQLEQICNDINGLIDSSTHSSVSEEL